jgi:hypothetical protein
MCGRSLAGNKCYRAFRLIDRNLIPRAIAFCATAPGVRRSFLAAWGPESFSFANVRRFFTSSLDHATNTRRFALTVFACAINVSFFKGDTSYRRWNPRALIFCHYLSQSAARDAESISEGSDFVGNRPPQREH